MKSVNLIPVNQINTLNQIVKTIAIKQRCLDYSGYSNISDNLIILLGIFDIRLSGMDCSYETI